MEGWFLQGHRKFPSVLFYYYFHSYDYLSRTSPSNLIHDKVGKGQGLMRLLQFSGILSNENRQKHDLSFWNDVIKEYFTPRALMKLTLWKDNQKNEAKPFGEYIHFKQKLPLPLKKKSLKIFKNKKGYLFILIFFRGSRYCCRNWRSYPSTILLGHHSIRCQIHDTLIRWCKGEATYNGARDRRMRRCGLDVQIHERIHGHAERTIDGSCRCDVEESPREQRQRQQQQQQQQQQRC